MNVSTFLLQPPTWVFYLIFLLILYLIPLCVGASRRHPSLAAIAFVNVVLGWTLFGWLWAMIWALSGTHAHSPPPRTVGPPEDGEWNNLDRAN